MKSPLEGHEIAAAAPICVDCPSDYHNDCRTCSPTINGTRSKPHGVELQKHRERLQRLRRASRYWHGIVRSNEYVDRSSTSSMSKTPEENKEDADHGFIGFVEADLSHGEGSVATADATKEQQEKFHKSVEKTTSGLGIRRKNIRNITKRMIASRETSKRISVLQRMQGSRVKTVQGVQAVEGGIILQSRHQAAVMKIQKVYRGRLARMKYVSRMTAAKLVKNVLKGSTAIRQTSTLKLMHEEAAIKLQAYRGYTERTKHENMNSCIVSYQKVAKHVFQENAETQLDVCRYLQRMEGAAVIIQAFRRTYCARKNGSHSRNKAIEGEWAGPVESTNQNPPESCANTDFLALKLQALYRGFNARQQLFATKSRKHDSRHVEACIVIQSHWRSFLCRREFALTVMDITTVQSVARRWFAIRRVHEINEAIFQKQHDIQDNDRDETLGCSKCGLNSELEATITTVSEDLSFYFRDVSLQEEMNELQLSFEEEMSEWQVSFEDEIAKIQGRIHEVARMDFWCEHRK